MPAPTVFISYSHADEVWKDRLVKHLGVLQHQRLLRTWNDRDIGAGDEWFEEIRNAMDEARVDRRGEGIALGNLGVAYKNLGEPRRAIEFYEQHLAIAHEIGDRQGEAIASWNLGTEIEKTGNLTRADELMQVVVDYEREIGHPDAEKDAARVAALRARIAERGS